MDRSRRSRVGRRLSCVASGAVAVAVWTSSVAFAASGDLDPSFGGDGIVRVERGGASALALQEDRKIVVVGGVAPRSKDSRIAVVRYRRDGGLDRTFGGDGLVATDVSAEDDGASDVAVQDDGKIVVVGSAGSRAFAIVRYRADGRLDRGFGDGGWTTTFKGGPSAYASELAIQPDGRIVTCGSRQGPTGTYRIAVARLRRDGSLDPSFGGDGKVLIDIPGRYDRAGGCAVGPDGKVVIAAGNGNMTAIRLRSDGVLDPTFAGDGIVSTTFDGWATGNDVAIDPSGRVVVVGGAVYRIAVVRYTAEGAPDPTFGGDGVVTTSAQGAEAGTVDIADDDRIVVAGAGGAGGDSYYFTVGVYEPDGDLDPGFHGGLVHLTFGDYRSSASDVEVAPNGKIVAVGWSDNINVTVGDRQCVVVRLLLGSASSG